MVLAINYGPIRDTALKLIKGAGRPCMLLRPVQGTAPDATKPWRVNDGMYVQYPFIGAYSVYINKRGGGDEDQSDCFVLMPGDVTKDSNGNVVSAIEPMETDRLQIFGSIGGETDPIYKIMDVGRIDPNGTFIAFRLVLRSQPFVVTPPAEGM